MKKTKTQNNYFLNYAITLKSIDLHGETKDIARLLTIDFLKENITNKDKKVVIIHGAGTGVLREEVFNILRKNREILKFTPQNNGATLVEYIKVGKIKT